MMHAVVVVPTYNERENIEQLLDALLEQQSRVRNTTVSILVVDDSSPDGTGEIVKKKKLRNPSIHLLTGKKEGLGKAYLRGFRYAMQKLKADIVLETDADFSHDPYDIPRLIQEIQNGNDFVIGSRYITGGSIPTEWGLLRKLNSKAGNILARYVTNMKEIHDCTGGFRAIRTSLLKKLDLNTINVSGYAFQISLLYLAKQHNARIVETPIQFIDRKYGESKIRLADILEFIYYAFCIRFPLLTETIYFLLLSLVGFIFGIAFFWLMSNRLITATTLYLAFVLGFALFRIVQSIFALYLMIYAWENPEENQVHAPKSFKEPKHSFTLLVPARHEERVIGHTLAAMATLNYPTKLFEVLVICKSDDIATIAAVKQAFKTIQSSSFKLVLFDDSPINKPHSLNLGLKAAKNEIISVFDAEDEPHQDILQVMNTLFMEKEVDVIQGGVQLMNYTSSWYSTFNVLEYFFWFKSTLQFFAKKGFIPLGGNTVFFKKKTLEKAGGWDEACLTEDAEIGVRLSAHNTPMMVVYDEVLATREETPHSLESFIKQRTRWNQGFMQVLMKGEWVRLNKVSQKLLALYILGWPVVQALFVLYIPISLLMIFFMKLPIGITMLTLLPMYLLILHLITQMIGLLEFTREYHLKLSFWVVVRSLCTFYLFQVVLGVSSLRALFRYLNRNNAWEKTLHMNTHRTGTDFGIIYMPLANN